MPKPNKITDRFEASELKKEMYYHPDTVWILPNSSYDKVEEDSLIFLDVDRPYIKLRKKKDMMYSSPKKLVYEFDRHYVRIDSTTDKDSLINKVMNIRYVNYYNGKYRQATDYIRKFGGFFERFSDRKNIFNKEQISELILKEADLNDELVRKLIVLEFVL